MIMRCYIFNSHVLMNFQMKWTDLNAVIMVLLLLLPLLLPEPAMPMPMPISLYSIQLSFTLLATAFQPQQWTHSALHANPIYKIKMRTSEHHLHMYIKYPTLFRCFVFCSLPCVNVRAFLFYFCFTSILDFYVCVFVCCWIRWCIWPTGPVVRAHKSASRQVMWADLCFLLLLLLFFRIEINRM